MLRDAVKSCPECPLGRTGACRFKPRALAAGARVWDQGDEARSLVFVKEGVVALTSSDAEGRELSAGVRGPRSLLGLEGLRGNSTSASVVALTRTTVCTANVESVNGKLGSDETAALLDFALDELQQTARDTDLRTGPALSRVARFVLRHADLIRHGRRSPFSKRHVAQLLAIRAETFSRCLKVLEDGGLISRRGEALNVRDRRQLEVVASGSTLRDE